MESVTRQIKLETIKRSVAECSKAKIPANREKIIGECGAWWGCRRQTAQELLKQLETNEAIHCDGNDVWTYDRWEKIKDAKRRDFMKGANFINKTFLDYSKNDK